MKQRRPVIKWPSAMPVRISLWLFAYDASLHEVLDVFSEEANDWRTKGWKEKGQWRFMGDFGRAVRVLYRTFGVQLPPF